MGLSIVSRIIVVLVKHNDLGGTNSWKVENLWINLLISIFFILFPSILNSNLWCLRFFVYSMMVKNSYRKYIISILLR